MLLKPHHHSECGSNDSEPGCHHHDVCFQDEDEEDDSQAHLNLLICVVIMVVVMAVGTAMLLSMQKIFENHADNAPPPLASSESTSLIGSVRLFDSRFLHPKDFSSWLKFDKAKPKPPDPIQAQTKMEAKKQQATTTTQADETTQQTL